MLGSMTSITPNLWCDGDAEAAAALYTSAFPDSRVLATSRYPATDLPEFQAAMAGSVLTIDLEIGGHPFTLINAGPEFPITPALSFMVNFDPSRDPDARDHLDALWVRLLDGGRALMELGEHPFSAHYGWVEDRHGVSWQLILTDPAGEPRPFIVPALLFGGAAQNQAAAAVDHYLSVFPGSRLGTRVLYAEPTGPASAGAVMFSDFQLADQWFVAMDAGGEQDFSFTEGVSLSVTCADQVEIDRVWSALSAVPESEQCGWCKDRFGVSWQVVPEGMAELMAGPDAYRNLLEMKKIVIADFSQDG